jgi:hypothetical protein
MTTSFVPSVKRGWGIQQRFFLLQAGLCLGLTVVLAGVQIVKLRASLETDYGVRALNVSRSVAIMPSVIAAMDSQRPQDFINPLMNRLRVQVGADFIVVGNRAGIRFSHPLPERTGPTACRQRNCLHRQRVFGAFNSWQSAFKRLERQRHWCGQHRFFAANRAEYILASASKRLAVVRHCHAGGADLEQFDCTALKKRNA